MLLFAACIISLFALWFDLFFLASWNTLLTIPATLSVMFLLRANNNTQILLLVTLISGYLLDIHTALFPFGFFIALNMIVYVVLLFAHENLNPIKEGFSLSLVTALSSAGYALCVLGFAYIFIPMFKASYATTFTARLGDLVGIMVLSFILASLLRQWYWLMVKSMQKWFFVHR